MFILAFQLELLLQKLVRIPQLTDLFVEAFLEHFDGELVLLQHIVLLIGDDLEFIPPG